MLARRLDLRSNVSAAGTAVCGSLSVDDDIPTAVDDVDSSSSSESSSESSSDEDETPVTPT
jgi:hypothetical protein